MGSSLISVVALSPKILHLILHQVGFLDLETATATVATCLIDVIIDSPIAGAGTHYYAVETDSAPEIVEHST